MSATHIISHTTTVTKHAQDTKNTPTDDQIRLTDKMTTASVTASFDLSMPHINATVTQ